jgi:hypothetical protein
VFIPFDKVNAEMKKLKKELEKSAMNDGINMAQTENWKAEMNKALAEIDNLKIPFIANSFNPKLRKEMVEMMYRLDTLKSKKFKHPHPSVQNIIDDDNEEVSSGTSNDILKKEKITSTIKQTGHRNKTVEIFLSHEENKEPIKIVIDLDND